MSNLTEFLTRNIGTWDSTRIYYEPSKIKITKPYLIKTVTTVSNPELDSTEVITFLDNLAKVHGRPNVEAAFLITWVSLRDNRIASEGSILSLVDDNLLIRDKGYMTKDFTFCKASFPKENQVSLETTYNKHNFVEVMTLLDVNTRSRSTNQYSVSGEFERAGRYLEVRMD